MRQQRTGETQEETRRFDKDGDAEMLMEIKIAETVEPQHIEHNERTLRETYVEPTQVFPILSEPRLDEKRTGGLNEELVSKAMKAEWTASESSKFMTKWTLMTLRTKNERTS